MKKIRNIIVLLAIPIWVSAQSISMDIISGNGLSDPNNQAISWTTGELAIQQFQTSNSIISQGFHQGQLIMTNVLENESLIEINVYPNPTVSNIIIETDHTEKLLCNIYNMLGDLIMHAELSESITKIDMEELAASTYFLQIIKNNKPIEIHKIQKIK